MGKPSDNAVVALLRIPVIRRLWAAIAVSSFGDWLGLLANTALAQQLTADRSMATQGVAISGVILTRLLPDLLLGPIAGALADRLDRRRTIIIGDLLAGLLFISIALAYDLTWLYVAQFLIEAVGLFTMPAKQAVWVSVVPRPKLPVANQLSLISVYGAVPVAALVFAVLSTLNRFFQDPLFASARVPIVIALAFNAATFFIGAATVYVARRDIPHFLAGQGHSASLVSAIREGVSFIAGSPVLRGLYVGILGAFLAGGAVVGVAQLYVVTLDAGNAGYSILFGTVFTGLALGMVLGPKLLPGISRRRMFGLTVALSGATLMVMALVGDFVLVLAMALLVGAFGGIAWITGYTMIGYEVEDRLRGRVFAFVMSSVRIALLVSVAAGPLLAGLLGERSMQMRDSELELSGPATVLLVAGALATLVGLYAYRRVGGKSRTRLIDVLWRSVARPELLSEDPIDTGLFVAFEGICAEPVAEQSERLADALTAEGYPVIRGWERAGVASPTVSRGGEGARPNPHADALRYLADQAEHVATVLRPALLAQQIVLCRGYLDASLAQHGAGLGLDTSRLRRTSHWVTGGLAPQLTVLLDAATPAGADPAVREAHLALAEADADRYLVLPADLAPDRLADAVRQRVTATLAARSERVARSTAPGTVVAAG